MRFSDNVLYTYICECVREREKARERYVSSFYMENNYRRNQYDKVEALLCNTFRPSEFMFTFVHMRKNERRWEFNFFKICVLDIKSRRFYLDSFLFVYDSITFLVIDTQ